MIDWNLRMATPLPVRDVQWLGRSGHCSRVDLRRTSENADVVDRNPPDCVGVAGDIIDVRNDCCGRLVTTSRRPSETKWNGAIKQVSCLRVRMTRSFEIRSLRGRILLLRQQRRQWSILRYVTLFSSELSRYDWTQSWHGGSLYDNSS